MAKIGDKLEGYLGVDWEIVDVYFDKVNKGMRYCIEQIEGEASLVMDQQGFLKAFSQSKRHLEDLDTDCDTSASDFSESIKQYKENKPDSERMWAEHKKFFGG